MNDFMKDLESELTGKGPAGPKVHLRVQQRTTRKSITTVEGVDPDIDIKRLLKMMKKRFSCNGNIEDSEEYGKVIKLTGDQRENVRDLLVDTMKIVNSEDVVVHGF